MVRSVLLLLASFCISLSASDGTPSTCSPQRFGHSVKTQDCISAENQLMQRLGIGHDYTAQRDFTLYYPSIEHRIPNGINLGTTCALGFDLTNPNAFRVSMSMFEIRHEFNQLMLECVQNGRSGGTRSKKGIDFFLVNPQQINCWGTCLASSYPVVQPQRISALQCLNMHSSLRISHRLGDMSRAVTSASSEHDEFSYLQSSTAPRPHVPRGEPSEEQIQRVDRRPPRTPANPGTGRGRGRAPFRGESPPPRFGGDAAAGFLPPAGYAFQGAGGQAVRYSPSPRNSLSPSPDAREVSPGDSSGSGQASRQGSRAGSVEPHQVLPGVTWHLFPTDHQESMPPGVHHQAIMPPGVHHQAIVPPGVQLHESQHLTPPEPPALGAAAGATAGPSAGRAAAAHWSVTAPGGRFPEGGMPKGAMWLSPGH